MIRNIYLYDVSLKVQHTDGERQLMTSRQHAYSVQDAVMQAVYETSALYPGASITLDKVGPPEEAIRDMERELAETVASAALRIMQKAEG